MSTVSFLINRPRSVGNFFRWTTLRSALSYDYTISLQVDGAPHLLEVGGKAVSEIPTGWGDSLNATELLEFLRTYRTSPEHGPADERFRRALHHFLFAGGALDGPFAAAAEPSEVLIRSDSQALPLLVNIPWELADGVPQLVRPGQTSPLKGTLASLPLARVQKNALTTTLDVLQERLKVLYCISEADGLQAIGAPRFQLAIDQILRERLGMLERSSVCGANFRPRFGDLEAAITSFAPHVVIIICHGQISGGTPQLRFEKWIPVENLAARLLSTRKALLLFLLACDQVFLEDGPSANSGAMAIVAKGIPAVVAMQSSVRADLAADFLGATLDNFFHSGIAQAVAEGRKQMAPAKAADSLLDWSFPVLFFTEDAPQRLTAVANSLKFQPALEAMMRSIPDVNPYFARSHIDGPLEEWLKSETAGLRAVTGNSGMGRTTAVRFACRNAIAHAIGLGDATFRPILYVDFQRYGDSIVTAQDLLQILRDRTEEIRSLLGANLITNLWPVARGSDGQGQPRDLVRQLLEIVDSNRMVLIVDHPPQPLTSLFADFLKGAQALSSSAVIAIGDNFAELRLGAAHVLKVVPLNREETSRYLETHVADHHVDVDELFASTGGVPCLLDAIFRLSRAGLDGMSSSGHNGDENFLLDQAAVLYSAISPPERAVLCQIAYLPNGINSEIAWEYISDWWHVEVPELVDKGLLTSEYRQSVRWMSIPGLVAQALAKKFSSEFAEAGRILAETFMERLSGNQAGVERSLAQLIDGPGGLEFVHSIHRLLIVLEYKEQFRALPVLLNDELYRRGRWNDALNLWKRTLEVIPLESTAEELICFAKAAHLLGNGSEASAALDRAESLDLTDLDRIGLLLLRAALVKDSGALERASEVTDIYSRVQTLITQALINADEPTSAAIGKVQATALYNGALHRRYWLHDLDGALADLEEAATQFAANHDPLMKALSDCEWAEVQLAASGQSKDWAVILQRLIQADQVLGAEGSAGDSAFCNYQLARCYRRKPAATPEETKSNLLKARDAYKTAVKWATLAGDLRQQQIAEGNLIEISWKHLNEITSAEAGPRLDEVIRLLRGFQGDAWSSRVLRDLLLLRASADDAQAQTTLEQAWRVAIGAPLNAKGGTDAKRAAKVLCELIRVLISKNELFNLDKIVVPSRDLIETWIGHPIEPTNPNAWAESVCLLGRAPGEYNGQSTG